MDRGEAVSVIDVRQAGGYDSSPDKIRGAVRIDPNDEQSLLDFAKRADKNGLVAAY